MFRRFLFAFLCIAASLVTANAQSNFAVVRGSVLDRNTIRSQARMFTSPLVVRAHSERSLRMRQGFMKSRD